MPATGLSKNNFTTLKADTKKHVYLHRLKFERMKRMASEKSLINFPRNALEP